MAIGSLEMKSMPREVVEGLKELIGKECTLQRIGTDRSLFIGFGSITTTTAKPHAEFEIGTYDCAWRVFDGKRILCGRNDAVDDMDELNQRFSKLQLGKIVSIDRLTELDTRIEFSNGLSVDICCTISDDDQILHIFLPMKRVIRFSLCDGWRIGPSDSPW